MKLLPHQTALVETVFNPASKRVILLRGDVGLGKTAALVAVVGRLLQERPMARALFLVPSVLQLQIVEMLRDANVPSLLVDRYRFREMLDATAGGEIWPGGTVAVLSLDFGKQPDVRDSLARTHWDLVIAEEGHWIRGARAEALHRIGASAERVVLTVQRELEPPAVFQAADATVVEWWRERIVDDEGKLLYSAPRSVLHEIRFSLNAAELRLRATVSDLCEILGDIAGTESWRAMTLFRSLESSPAALERALQRLAERAALESVDDPLEPLEDSIPDENISTGQLDRPTAEKVAGVTGRALQEIEAIAGDSKLDAFGVLLTTLNEVKTPSRRFCVITDYRATLYYVAAEVEGRGMDYLLLHGGMAAEARTQSLELFSNAGGILVATTAVMTQPINLSEVTDLVLYDVPGSKLVLQQVLGRFDRIGRLRQLNVHVLVPSNSSDGAISKSLGLLREILEFRSGTQPTH